MTNEQWFVNLSTEEKAKFMSVEGKYNNKETMQLMLLATSKTLKEWLQKEHIEPNE